MPQQTTDTYHVDFPDGTISFTGPYGMSDADVYNKAVQERAVKSGKIQTTFAGGALKSLGEDDRTTQALLTGLSLVPGMQGVAAAAPLGSKLIRVGTQKLTGEKPDDLEGLDLAQRIGEGGLALAGARIPNATQALRESTYAHQLPSGQWVKGIRGEGFLPWAVREGSRAADYMGQNYVKPAAAAIQALPLYWQNLVRLSPDQ